MSDWAASSAQSGSARTRSHQQPCGDQRPLLSAALLCVCGRCGLCVICVTLLALVDPPTGDVTQVTADSARPSEGE